MNREVDLLSYLPPFLQDFKENRETLEAENPEFTLAWNSTDKVLRNEFIETADEYGIARFEGILGIFSSRADTLESRRRRVQARWFNTIPYTLRVLLERLGAICGENNFTVTKKFLNYRIDITMNLELSGQGEEVDRLLKEMVPCNMVTVSVNKIPCEPKGNLYTAGTVCFVEQIQVVDGGMITKITPYEVYGNGFTAGAVSHVEQIQISDKAASK